MTVNLWIISQKATKFNMSLRKAKPKLQRFLEYHPEMINPIEIRKDFRRNNRVKLPTITLKTYCGEPSDWKSFKETFEAAVHNNKITTNI